MPDLRYDIRQQQQLRRELRQDAARVDKALRWAVDAETRKAATFISRDIRDVYEITAGDVRDRLRILRAARDAERALLYTGRRLPLTKFKPRERWVPVASGRRVKSGPRKGRVARRRGVTVRVRKDVGRQLVPGGWHAKSHVLRRADSRDNKSQPRMQFGPSIPGMVAHPSTIEKAQEQVRRNLPVQFSNRLDYLMRQKTGQT